MQSPKFGQVLTGEGNLSTFQIYILLTPKFGQVLAEKGNLSTFQIYILQAPKFGQVLAGEGRQPEPSDPQQRPRDRLRVSHRTSPSLLP